MNSKPTLRKTIQKGQSPSDRGSHLPKSYIDVGSWRFQENEEGDLIITHSETGQEITLILKDPAFAPTKTKET